VVVRRLERASEMPRLKGALKRSEEAGRSWVKCLITKVELLENMKRRESESERSKRNTVIVIVEGMI